MKRLSQLLPFFTFGTLLLLVAVWQFTDLTLIAVLPYFLATMNLAVGSLAVRVTAPGLARSVSWALFLLAAAAHASILLAVTDMRTLWKALVFLGLCSILLYLFALTRKSQLLGKRNALFSAVPLAVGGVFTLLFVTTGQFANLAFWGFILALLCALAGLLFGYRQRR